jgi:hypothetical protein
MTTYFRFDSDLDGHSGVLSALRSSGQFRFCAGKCQTEKPPEGGIETSPGKWRCGACWIDLARKRHLH